MPGQLHYYGTTEWGQPGGGLVSGVRGMRIRPWQLIESQNMELIGNSLVRRRGTTQLGTVAAGMAGRVSYLDRWYYSTVAGSLAAANGKLWYRTTGDWIDTAEAWTTTAFTVGTEFADLRFVVNGTNTPKKFTKAAAPSASTWTVASAGVPQWVAGPLYSRLFYNDSTNKEKVWYTNDGAPNSTDAVNWLRIPDDRMGQEMRIGVMCGNAIACLGSDWLVDVTGAGPLSLRTEKMPRGAALASWRTVVDMGGFLVYLTTRGLAMWDMDGPALLLDGKGEVDLSDIDFSTPEYIHAVRYFDKYLLFYRSKGMSTSPMMSISVAPSRYGVVANVLTSQISRTMRGVGFASKAQTSHYITWDRATRRFEGPHTGAWLSAVWQEYRNGDRQELMLGSATASGKIVVADQPDRYLDVGDSGDEGYESSVRFGAAGSNPFEEHVVERVQIMMGGRKQGGVLARLLFDGDDLQAGSETMMTLDPGGDINVHQEGSGAEGYGMNQGVWRRWRPGPQSGAGRVRGYAPQLELVVSDAGPWRLDGYQVVTKQYEPDMSEERSGG